MESKGLIKIELRENKIYGSSLTEKGKKIFNNDKYQKNNVRDRHLFLGCSRIEDKQYATS